VDRVGEDCHRAAGHGHDQLEGGGDGQADQRELDAADAFGGADEGVVDGVGGVVGVGPEEVLELGDEAVGVGVVMAVLVVGVVVIGVVVIVRGGAGGRRANTVGVRVVIVMVTVTVVIVRGGAGGRRANTLGVSAVTVEMVVVVGRADTVGMRVRGVGVR
jgi:hypothetical protein